MIGLDLSKCDYTQIDDNYGIIEYNEIKLYVSKDLEYFCASRLHKSFKYDRISSQNWFKRYILPKLKNMYPDLYRKVEGSNKIKGWYVHISLLNYIGYKIDAERFQLWISNEPWDEINKKGYLYMIQPARFVGTNIVKIGETSNFRKKINSL